jgi:hypothetical protein
MIMADGRMAALRSALYAQNLLSEPTPQTGTAGPVTLILGNDFAGVDRPARTSTKTSGSKPGKPGKAKQAAPPCFSATSMSSPGFVQARNAGASICSGLPQANRNSGSPP